ncbi:hypothetical protein SS50377_25337 [Spironucleus salmonicida]|uniref:Uncharacterized protein n=1 Tax=Spironucleus salmonicida TaxID=348837 RepID=V6LBF3_9EUKA|nr:hypothetical protein SS50377_25337 [Spironucleus salmonicida]|eukprot:EST41785.1 Hypothetical protein SS50377_18618 [Spironucleus salmonicida]
MLIFTPQLTQPFIIQLNKLHNYPKIIIKNSNVVFQPSPTQKIIDLAQIKTTLFQELKSALNALLTPYDDQIIIISDLCDPIFLQIIQLFDLPFNFTIFALQKPWISISRLDALTLTQSIAAILHKNIALIFTFSTSPAPLHFIFQNFEFLQIFSYHKISSLAFSDVKTTPENAVRNALKQLKTRVCDFNLRGFQVLISKKTPLKLADLKLLSPNFDVLTSEFESGMVILTCQSDLEKELFEFLSEMVKLSVIGGFCKSNLLIEQCCKMLKNWF